MRCYVCRKDISERQIDGKKAIFCEQHESTEIGAGALVNDGIARKDWYKKDVDKGVKGKDLIQPFLPDGSLNKDFFHHHGDKAFTTERDKARIKKELG